MAKVSLVEVKRNVKEIMENAMADEGYVTIRLAGQVYDTRRKMFVGFKDGTVNFKVRSIKGVGVAIDKMIAALRQLTVKQ